MKHFFCTALLFLTACTAPVDKPVSQTKANELTANTTSQNIYLVNNGGCVYVDSLVIDSIGNNLFLDKKGNVYFKTYDRSMDEKVFPVLISSLYNACEGDSSYALRRNIHLASFRSLGANYYKDTNHVFVFNQMLDGGNLVILDEAHLKSFRVLQHSFYATDKHHVYYMGRVLEKADPESFQCIYKSNNGDTLCHYGKDRRNYFYGENISSKAKTDEFLEE